VLDGTDTVYVARVATRRIISVGITVGTRFPAYATSMGRVLLAGLPAGKLEASLASTNLRALTPRTLHDAPSICDEVARVREQGWAYVDQELERGLHSLAVPVLGPHGDVVAALNVSATATDDAAGFASAALDALRRTAADVAATGHASHSR
jgi:IclR family pca regulon transcriptional regulator